MTSTISRTLPSPTVTSSGSRSGPIRLGVVCDYLEENWPSMELVGEMILSHLRQGHAETIEAVRLRPRLRPRAGRLPGLGRIGSAHNVDRLLGRFWDYPRWLKHQVRREPLDLYHLVDHSYSQLIHALPPGRAVVTCHDLDTFRCLLEPGREPRPLWFRAMTRRILNGFQKAAAVACDSEATRDAILAHDLLPPERLHVIYLAVHPECNPEADPEADARASALLGPMAEDPDESPDLLYVGSNIPRKRIDVLLGAFAGVRRALPKARLIKVGGPLNPDQARMADDLGIADAIVTLPFFSPRQAADRATLAAVYRRASLCLQPSEAEGFGLPVAESLACGTPILASDIPVLREVGGPAASFAPVGDPEAWSESILALLATRRHDPAAWRRLRDQGLAWASRYRWTNHVDRLAELYRDVLTKVPS